MWRIAAHDEVDLRTTVDTSPQSVTSTVWRTGHFPFWPWRDIGQSCSTPLVLFRPGPPSSPRCPSLSDGKPGDSRFELPTAEVVCLSRRLRQPTALVKSLVARAQRCGFAKEATRSRGVRRDTSQLGAPDATSERGEEGGEEAVSWAVSSGDGITARQSPRRRRARSAPAAASRRPKVVRQQVNGPSRPGSDKLCIGVLCHVELLHRTSTRAVATSVRFTILNRPPKQKLIAEGQDGVGAAATGGREPAAIIDPNHERETGLASEERPDSSEARTPHQTLI